MVQESESHLHMTHIRSGSLFSPDTLAQKLLDARQRTLMLMEGLGEHQLLGPKLSIVNPPLWELGHLGWFQERWCLRRSRADDRLSESLCSNADALYDSARVAHDTRWALPLPCLKDTLEYLRTVLERVLERLASDRDASLDYFAELAALHEEMHCEAFTYTRQTLAYPAPGVRVSPRCTAPVDCIGDVSLPARSFMLGAARDLPFVFDNEKWAHPVRVEAFAISRTCVTNAQYSAFVDDRGYARPDLWCDEGRRWRTAAAAEHPVYWRKEGGSWCTRRYDQWIALQADEPVIHVNWYEANAYCRWAGRRLPSEVEWECAASSVPGDNPTKRRYPWGAENPGATRANLYGVADHVVPVSAHAAGDSAWGVRQLLGNVWEWTADSFMPYPGFVADPYKEYSEPWFGNHKVLRGGSFATRSHLIRNTWRNFYTPDRRDVFAGFRTCA